MEDKVLEVTDAAKGKLQKELNNNPGKLVRITMGGFGWGGPKIGLVLDEPQVNETAIKVNGLDVLVDEDIKDIADRTKIDIITTPYGEAFTVGQAGCSGC